MTEKTPKQKNYDYTANERKIRYNERNAKKGLKRVNLWVHVDNVEELKAISLKLREPKNV